MVFVCDDEGSIRNETDRKGSVFGYAFFCKGIPIKILVLGVYIVCVDDAELFHGASRHFAFDAPDIIFDVLKEKLDQYLGMPCGVEKGEDEFFCGRNMGCFGA